MFKSLMDTDPLVRGADPDPYRILPSPWFLLFCDFFMTFIFEDWCLCTFKKLKAKNLKETYFLLHILVGIYHKSRIRIRIRIRNFVVRISGSGSVPTTLPAIINNYVLFCVTGARERLARVWAICWPCEQRQDWRINDVSTSGIGRETCRMILLKTSVQFLWECRGFSDFQKKGYFGFVLEPDVSTINIIR